MLQEFSNKRWFGQHCANTTPIHLTIHSPWSSPSVIKPTSFNYKYINSKGRSYSLILDKPEKEAKCIMNIKKTYNCHHCFVKFIILIVKMTTGLSVFLASLETSLSGMIQFLTVLCSSVSFTFWGLPTRMVYLYNYIEGSRPEWCISSMIYSRDTPFWSGTLDI